MTKRVFADLSKELSIILVGVFLMTQTWGNTTLLTAILALLLALSFHLLRLKKVYLIHFTVGAIIGSSVEIILIQHGAWAYTKPSFLGIPMWLPVAWGFVCVMLVKIAETLRKVI
ncbi:MAG: hypothetical protein ABH834_08385 [Candidatus Altiarchaeota archaeon]